MIIPKHLTLSGEGTPPHDLKEGELHLERLPPVQFASELKAEDFVETAYEIWRLLSPGTSSSLVTQCESALGVSSVTTELVQLAKDAEKASQVPIKLLDAFIQHHGTLTRHRERALSRFVVRQLRNLLVRLESICRLLF